MFLALSVIEVLLHTYSFPAPVFPLTFTLIEPDVAPAATVIVVEDVRLLQVWLLVAQPYLIV